MVSAGLGEESKSQTRVRKNLLENTLGTSLVVRWLRILLPMQGTQVRSLIREDPTCCRATKPMPHNYGAPLLQQEKPLQGEACALHLEGSPRGLQLEKVCAQQ